MKVPSRGCASSARWHLSKGVSKTFLWFDKGAKMFFLTGNMLTHIKRVHSGFELEDEDVHKCSHCTCAFRKIGSLRSHLSRFHNDDENEENQGENQDK